MHCFGWEVDDVLVGSLETQDNGIGWERLKVLVVLVHISQLGATNADGVREKIASVVRHRNAFVEVLLDEGCRVEWSV